MMKKQTGRSPSLMNAVLKGTGIAIGWTVLCAMIIAKLIDGEVMPMESVGYGSMAAHLSAVYLGALAAYKSAGHMGDAAAGITGGSYYMILLLVNALFFGGQFTGLGITLTLVVLASGAVILTAGKGRRRQGRRRYKIPRA